MKLILPALLLWTCAAFLNRTSLVSASTWRGIGTDTLSNDAQKNIRKIDKALTRMFQKFSSGQ